jgi:hypothetical protein
MPAWWLVLAAMTWVSCSKDTPVSAPIRVEPPKISPTPDAPPTAPVNAKWFHVSGLPFETTDGPLREVFGTHGRVTEARVVRDRDTGRSLGFGFVEITSPRTSRLLEQLDGVDVGGRVVRVEQAYPDEPATGASTATSVTSGDRRVTLGDRLVMTATGEIGRVTRIDIGSAPPTLEISSPLGRVRMSIEAHDSWRPIATAEEAERLEAKLLSAKPFDDGTMHDARRLRWRDAAFIGRLRTYLEGDADQVITGLATLVDWAAEAGSADLRDGAWLGWLHYARDGLLGEIAYARELPFDVFVERLTIARSAVDRQQLRRVGTTPAAPATPSASIASAQSSELGAHALGNVTLGREALVASPVWHGRVIEQALRDGTRVPTEPGVWTVWLVTQSETMPSELAREVATLHGDDASGIEYTFTSVFRRSWLLLTRASDEPKPPSPNGSATPTYEELAKAEEAATRGQNDPLDEVALVTRIGGERVALQRLGWTQSQRRAVAILDGESLSPAVASALGAAHEAEVNLWSWGVSYYRGEWVSPIYAAGPEQARTLIAVPARPF